MGDFLGNLSVILGGLFGGGIGFLIIALFVVVLLAPLFGMRNFKKDRDEPADIIEPARRGVHGIEESDGDAATLRRPPADGEPFDRPSVP